jgi:hypothetical protein
MIKRLVVISGAIAVCLYFGARVFSTSHEIVSTSPNGLYSFKVELRKDPPKGTRSYTEHGKITASRGKVVICTYEWDNSEEFGATFLELNTVIEWVGENAIRVGGDRSDQPFLDTLVVTNNSNERIKYIELSYGRAETFWIFDIDPNATVSVKASPNVKPDPSLLHDNVGFGGETVNGNKFRGVAKGHRSGGNKAQQVEIAISQTDLKDL